MSLFLDERVSLLKSPYRRTKNVAEWNKAGHALDVLKIPDKEAEVLWFSGVNTEHGADTIHEHYKTIYLPTMKS